MARKKDDLETTRLSAINEDLLTALGGQEFYGLEILDHLNFGRTYTLSFGSLYPALNRLIKKGYIEWRWGDEQDGSGGARRKYYKSTEFGINTLKEVQNYRLNLALRVKSKLYKLSRFLQKSGCYDDENIDHSMAFE